MNQNGSISGRVSLSNRNVFGNVNTRENVSGETDIGNAISQILTATTEEWNSNPTLVSKKNTLYIYSDYDNNGSTDIPAAKIGDGSAYLIDLPFIESGGITYEQIQSWNNKVTAFINPENPSNLVLSKD